MWGEVFDPTRDWHDDEASRPHWAQANTIAFITFGLNDAIPRHVVETWEREKAEWLIRHGCGGEVNWRDIVPTLPAHLRTQFHLEFQRKREIELDQCRGRCLLRRGDLARIVVDSLHHFDGDRYHLGDYVVMPNHVHLLASFPQAEQMRHQCASWLRFTATAINRVLGERGKIWRTEPFDHLVRSADQYEHLRRYIATNPVKAHLAPGQFVHHRRAKD